MILCFELSMPNVGSWNNGWSGEKNYYAKVINFGRTKKAKEKAASILKEGYYRYNFGDGWTAGISVKEIDAKEAAKIRRKSSFCGYDWMVQSIKDYNKILAEKPDNQALHQNCR